MGCCQSQASHEEAANAQPADDIPQAAPSSVPPPAVRARNANSRPNQRIRSPSPLAKSPKNVSNQHPPWTRSHLEEQRVAFFDTRVSGDKEIWVALRRTCELLRDGDLEGAQAIMDAANITCPSGRVSRARGRDRRGGVYDEKGALYDIPNWVLTDPLDIVADPVPEVQEDKIAAVEDSDDAQEDEEAAQRRVDKGKGREVDIGEPRQVKVRLSNGAGDFEVGFGSKQTAGTIVQKIFDKRNQKVRLMYLGKELDEKQTLEAQKWEVGKVLNGFLLAEAEPEARPS